jgi:hypothetical protein
MHDEPTGVYPRTTLFILLFEYILTSEFFKLVYLDKSCTRKGPGSAYDKWNISVITFYKMHNSLCPQYLGNCLPPTV